MFRHFIVIALTVMAFGCRPAMATDYVTQDELHTQLQVVHSSLNAAIGNGVRLR